MKMEPGRIYDNHGNPIGMHELVIRPRTPEFLRAVAVISVLDKYLSTMYRQAWALDRVNQLTESYVTNYHYRKDAVLKIMRKLGEANDIMRPILKENEFR